MNAAANESVRMSSSFKWALAVLALLALLTTWPMVLGDNDASRLATVQSLVELRTFSIDHLALGKTGDRVFVNNHFYSEKLPLPAVLGAIVYAPLFLAGLRLNLGVNAATYLITLIVIKGLWLGGLVAFYDALGFTRLTDRMRLWLTLALGIASLYFTWSSTFNNHSVAASFLIIGFDMLLRARLSGAEKRHLFWAGLCLALAGSADAPSGAFYVGGLVYLAADSRMRRAAAYYLFPLLITVVPTLAVNYSISGSLVPVQMVRAYFQYPGSKWLGPKGNELSGTGINTGRFLAEYVFNSLVGSRGFILYNPLLFLAIPLLARECAAGRKFRGEGLLVGIATAVIVAYYLLYTNNYGGWSYSVRFFVPLVPLLFFFLHPFLEEPTAARKAVFGALFALSTAIAAIGVISPWSHLYLSGYPLIANLMQLREDPGTILVPLAQLVGARP